ncbi:hypothetical protein [Halorubrum sp. SD626R]|uniref:hypothetical protein n=1 Tax=Halorubrum sp. SD626R TaxID=1419722 RepID=UPI000B16FAD0|nr:hypothetical protein [Halorubrum sp. SD626R]TKX82052.1 hypothetical protein EXE53_00110 [Halorubrum sp. SD626R]
MTTTSRPALPTLQSDQRALLEPQPGDGLDHGLRDGFPNRRTAIEWYQAAIVRTIGHITDRWDPVALLRDRTLLTALVVGPERERFADDPISLETGREYRQRLERVLVLPAFNLAYNALRKSAGEYPEDVRSEEHDPEGQDFVAMRPAFQVADQQQRAALRRLWGASTRSRSCSRGSTISPNRRTARSTRRCRRGSAGIRLLASIFSDELTLTAPSKPSDWPGSTASGSRSRNCSPPSRTVSNGSKRENWRHTPRMG